MITLAVIAAVTALILTVAGLLGAHLGRCAERQSTPLEAPTGTSYSPEPQDRTQGYDS